MKGRDPGSELASLSDRGERVEVVPVSVPGLAEGQRHLVIVTRADQGN